MKHRKFLKLLTSKFLLVCILLLIEMALLPTVILVLSAYFQTIATIVTVLYFIVNVILILYIINSEINAEFKIAWLVPILLLPPVGCILYLTLRRRKAPRRKLKKLLDRISGMNCLYTQNLSEMQKFEKKDDFAAQCARFISRESLLPAATCRSFEYFPSGEAYFEHLTEELKKAKKYIFLEYFIIAYGKFWNTVLEILKGKVGEGVDARIIYDDIGSMLKVSSNYAEELEKMGIKCLCFNRFRPVLDVAQNNRTHRKIAVIDGNTAFTGGINLADEYINEVQPFGHWKDTGVMIKGIAAQNFAALFLQLWALKAGDTDYSAFRADEKDEGSCLCFPFGDSPFDGERNICEDLYIKILYHAKKYVYINTPYLIIDGEMKRALVTAARSGVDVRITIPETPDKRYVYAITKAFSSQLIKEGIKIYHYTPGFIHAKSIVSDGLYSIIGSTNMDFRSFYMHYECNALFADENISEELRKDYLETCEKCKLITQSDIKTTLPRLLYRAFLRIFAPLM